jgi:hypothetical protein
MEGFAQIRPREGGCPYAPFRDLINCFPQIARRAAYLLAPEAREPWFEEYLKSAGVTDDELSEAAKCVALYINHTCDPTIGDPLEVLALSGFNKLSVAAQLAILARVGQVTMAMFFACARDALRPNEKPTGLDQLIADSGKIAAAIKGVSVSGQ